MQPPPGGVSIRMYRQGLGDCFLLAFDRGKTERPFHMLIDCGVILGTKDPATIMKRVVEDVCETTDSYLDLLVVTHEHWDHLSGFVEARDVFFNKLQGNIGACWMGWTEKPDEDIALQIQGDRRRRALALQAFAAHYQQSSSVPFEAAGQVNALLAFHGLGAAKTAGTTTEALENVRKIFEGEPEYLKPGGEPIELTGLPGVRFFVLGPPVDPKDIRKVRPSTVTPETYHRFDRLTFNAESAFFAAALGGNAQTLFEDPAAMERQSRPFSDRESIAEHRVLGTKNRASATGELSDVDYLRHLYKGRKQGWRTIDQDWLNTAAVLALQLDNLTNNTSLALAIQLCDGKVLLFPGDAQVGSWLSWHKLSWQLNDGSAKREMKITELLSQTVFYKVSHHGSHNATLRDLGLRLMTSEELVAMIPVDEKVARNTKHWDMPFGPLLRDLRRRARQRVMQVALLKGQKQIRSRGPDSVSPALWKRFRDSVQEDPLFWQYNIAPLPESQRRRARVGGA
jgi:hypothetical protein